MHFCLEGGNLNQIVTHIQASEFISGLIICEQLCVGNVKNHIVT